MEELPSVLWAYWTTLRIFTREMSFNLAFGMEAIILVEIGLPTTRVKSYEEASKPEWRCADLDLIEETRQWA